MAGSPAVWWVPSRPYSSAARAPLRPLACSLSAPARCVVSRAGCVVLQYNPAFFPCPPQLYCNTIAQPNQPLVTIQSVVLRYNLSPQASFFAIQKLYCNTIFNSHSTCNTLHIAIQNLPNLQYNPFLAIKLGSSPIQISAPVFFSFFIIIFLPLFPAAGKTLKIINPYIYFFIFQNTQINL